MSRAFFQSAETTFPVGPARLLWPSCLVSSAGQLTISPNDTCAAHGNCRDFSQLLGPRAPALPVSGRGKTGGRPLSCRALARSRPGPARFRSSPAGWRGTHEADGTRPPLRVSLGRGYEPGGFALVGHLSQGCEAPAFHRSGLCVAIASCSAERELAAGPEGSWGDPERQRVEAAGVLRRPEGREAGS